MSDQTPRPTRVRIESLRVRVPGHTSADGYRFADALATNLSEQAHSLLTRLPNRSIQLGGLSLAVPARPSASSSKAVSAALLGAIIKAAQAERGK